MDIADRVNRYFLDNTNVLWITQNHVASHGARPENAFSLGPSNKSSRKAGSDIGRTFWSGSDHRNGLMKRIVLSHARF
jgi:hypothetical protein